GSMGGRSVRLIGDNRRLRWSRAMPMFPKIQSPCPYKSQLSAMMDGDFCRMCKRQVVDITEMTDAERVALIAGCADEICVSYRRPLRVAAAAAIAVVAGAAPLAAAPADASAASETTV